MIRALTVMSVTMAIAILLHSIGWSEGYPKIQLNAVAEIETKALDQEGRSMTRRIPAQKVVPGTEIIYTISYYNPADQAVQRLVITNPIPRQMHYRPQSIFGSEATFSVDSGRSFDRPENLYITDAAGKRYPAKPSQYTHIRWQLLNPVPPQASGQVGFRAILQ